MEEVEVHVLCANNALSCANVRKQMIDMGFEKIIKGPRTDSSDHYGVIKITNNLEVDEIVNQLQETVGIDINKLHTVKRKRQ